MSMFVIKVDMDIMRAGDWSSSKKAKQEMTLPLSMIEAGDALPDLNKVVLGLIDEILERQEEEEGE